MDGNADTVRTVKQAAKGTFESEEIAQEWQNNQDELCGELLTMNQDRIEDLENAGLSSQEARVTALKAVGLSHRAVALVLEIDESTVGEYVRRVRSKREDAEQLLESLDVHGVDL